MIFPDRPIEDLTNEDEIFHVVYDLDDRVQIPGTRYIWGRPPVYARQRRSQMAWHSRR